MLSVFDFAGFSKKTGVERQYSYGAVSDTRGMECVVFDSVEE